MVRSRFPFVLAALAVMVTTGCDRCAESGCDTPDCNPAATPYELEIPPFFPPMDIPQDNPLTVEGIELGRLLFWEKDLSADGSMSCGSCHLPEAGFADPNPYSTGITGSQGVRNAMALINIGWAPSYFWDGRALTLEEQILEPVSHPDEMALPWADAVDRLQATESEVNAAINYPDLFEVAFTDRIISPELVTKAIAQFLRTMVSADSKFEIGRAHV